MHTSRIGISRRRHRSGAKNPASEILFLYDVIIILLHSEELSERRIYEQHIRPNPNN